MTLPVTYLRWNEKLLRFCLANSVDQDGRFFLTVDQMLDEEEDPAAAKQDYVAAVQTVYAERGAKYEDAVFSLLGTEDPDSFPLYAALLGVSVIAAESMHGLEYYKHLASLLNQPQIGSGVRWFVHASYETAWKRLSEWLEMRGLFIELPHERTRFISWPKMHALLRAVDTEKLPRFFRFADLRPTRRSFPDDVESRFSEWINSGRSGITELGRMAWHDNVRRPGVLRQVLRTLELWDVNEPDDTFRRSAAIRRSAATLVVDVVGNHASVVLRARHLSGFPTTIPFGESQFTCSAAERDYYDDLKLNPSWTSLLASGIETPSGRQRVTWAGGDVFALLEMDYATGYESSPRLRLGVNSAVLCRSSLAEVVERHLCAMSDRVPSRGAVNALPGWRLFYRFRPVRSSSPPTGLEALNVDSGLLLRPEGGLRLGYEQAWLAGAPPRRFHVVGENPPETVSINGTSYPLDSDNELQTEDLLAATGRYEVRAGSERYILSIVEPVVRFREYDQPDIESIETVALWPKLDIQSPPIPDGDFADSTGTVHDAAYFEEGEWTYIGYVVGSVSKTVESRFSPQWAVGKLAGRLSVVALCERPATPIRSDGIPIPFRRCWADAVLTAATGRLGYINENIQPNALRPLWSAYVCAAVDEKKWLCRREAARGALCL